MIRADLDGRPDLLEHPPRDGGDLLDGGFERDAVALRRGAVPTDLADELAGGRLDLTGRRRLVRTAKDLDASAHAGQGTASPSRSRVGGQANTRARPVGRARSVGSAKDFGC